MTKEDKIQMYKKNQEKQIMTAMQEQDTGSAQVLEAMKEISEINRGSRVIWLSLPSSPFIFSRVRIAARERLSSADSDLRSFPTLYASRR